MNSNNQDVDSVAASGKNHRDTVTPKVIVALQNGNHEAYNTIFLAWNRPVYNLLLQLTGSESEAEDITQDVFCTLWEQRESINPGNRISTFLYMLAKRAAIDLFRRKRVAGEYASAHVWDEISGVATDNLVIEKEIILMKRLLLERMPEQQRTIYNLSHNEGLSNEQIADRLSISKTTVAQQLSRARKQLKEIMQLIIIFLAANNVC